MNIDTKSSHRFIWTLRLYPLQEDPSMANQLCWGTVFHKTKLPSYTESKFVFVIFFCMEMKALQIILQTTLQTTRGVWHGVSKRVENGRRPPNLQTATHETAVTPFQW
jgi:hypothetical protein